MATPAIARYQFARCKILCWYFSEVVPGLQLAMSPVHCIGGSARLNSVENAERTAARSDVLMTSGAAEADTAGVWRSGDDLGANWMPVAQAEAATMQMKVLRNCLKRAPLICLLFSSTRPQCAGQLNSTDVFARPDVLPKPNSRLYVNQNPCEL